MKTIPLSFRDADGQKGFQLEQIRSDTMIVKPGVFPGAFGHPDLHIVHLKREVRSLRHRADVLLMLICITEQSLLEADREKLLTEAETFARRKGAL